MLRPTLTAAKAVSLADRARDDEFLEGFLATERWGNDAVAFPGECYARYLTALYRENRLITGTFAVLGRHTNLTSIRCPVLAVAFANDSIVPVPSAQALIELVAPQALYTGRAKPSRPMVAW
ncbi:MAG: hypothetical protein H0T79_06040 [Deltaproteobacteria bacterium]|nr:hypothetical protein [Deltaproteobacteria bacterium]